MFLEILGCTLCLTIPIFANPITISAENEYKIFSNSTRNSTYWNLRKKLIEKDYSNILGNDQTLSKEEEEVNSILMSFKEEEIKKHFISVDYPPSLSFFHARDMIEKSEVFQMIKKMPKGSVLHAHDLALASLSWVISELTYWDDLYICQNSDNLTLFRFFNKPDGNCDWRLVKDERANYSSANKYDKYLHKELSMFTTTPEVDYPTIDVAWTKMENSFSSLIGLVSYVPAWIQYLTQAFREFVADNVLYLEFRGVLPLLYEKNGYILNEMETLAVYEKVIEEFKLNHKEDFFGARFIYAPIKNDDLNTIWSYVEAVKEMKIKFPALIAGFDLVGQEDKNKPLKEYIDPLLNLTNAEDVSLPVFFHAGETDWWGTDSDENLFDALLLDATRIGHGYAISKHPALLQMAKKAHIPMEVCPISNQVLMLLHDLRNHPMITLVSRGIEIVVSSDDPAVWEADPLSHDFYEAFHALGGGKSDLRFLKKLAINSIRYSSLEDDQKLLLWALWHKKWDNFIWNHANSSHSSPAIDTSEGSIFENAESPLE